MYQSLLEKFLSVNVKMDIREN